MTFNLTYTCKECNSSFPAESIDGRVSPPPDECPLCSKVPKDSQVKKNIRSPGSIIRGMRLDSQSSVDNKWLTQCLFCCEYRRVNASNLGKQKSCGCLRGAPLQPIDFREESVECYCRDCGLTAVYSLMTGVPIVCKSGCTK